jgi:hypothetical protein
MDSDEESDSQDAAERRRKGQSQAAARRRRVAAARIVDDEASEAGSEDSSRSLGWRDGREQWTYLDSFPRFMEMPAELRRKIWEEFCPDLVANARIFAVNPYQAHPKSPVRLEEGTWLRQQTAPTRTLMLVHRETQDLVLWRMPDPLRMNAPPERPKTIRLNYETDIVDITGVYFRPVTNAEDLRWAGLKSEQLAAVQNLAVTQRQLDWFFRAADVREHYPGLRTLYLKVPWNIYSIGQTKDEHTTEVRDAVWDPKRQDPASLRWCLAKSAQQVRQAAYADPTNDLGYGVGESFEQVLCWPNSDKVADFGAVRLFPSPMVWFGDPLEGGDFDHGRVDFIGTWGTDLQKAWALDRKRWIQSGRPTHSVDAPTQQFPGQPPTAMDKYAIWPLVHFDMDEGVRYFDALQEWNGKPEDWVYDEEEIDSRRESDEYESEGIDDGDIEEDDSSEEADDLAVQPLSDLEDAEDDGMDDEAEEMQLRANHELVEIKSSDSKAESEDGEAEEEISSAPSKRKRGTQPAPSRKRQAVALDSEDEEGIVELQMPVRKRNPRGYTIISDDDDDEEEDGGDEAPQPEQTAGSTARSRRKAARRVAASSDREEPTSESDSDDGAGKQPLSLMDQLRLGREQHPIPVDDSDPASNEEGRDAEQFPQAQWSDEEEEEDDEDRDELEEIFDQEGEISENESE